MLALIEGAAERLADLLAEATRDANALSQRAFDEENLDLRAALRDLGRVGALSALAHDLLTSLQRLLVYARESKGKYGAWTDRGSPRSRAMWANSSASPRRRSRGFRTCRTRCSD